MQQYWDVFQLSPGATVDDIKKRYRRLAIDFHPDKNPHRVKWAEEQFKRLQEAYQWLLANWDVKPKEEVIYRSSMSDTSSRKSQQSPPPKGRQPNANSSFNDPFMRKWDDKESELYEGPDANIERNTYLNADGSANCYFTLDQLLLGCEIDIHVKAFAKQKFKISPNTLPNTRVKATLLTEGKWMPPYSNITIVCKLLPHHFYSVSQNNLECFPEISLTDALTRKPFTIEHPFLVSELSNKPIPLLVTLPDRFTTGDCVTIPNLGFSNGDLKVYPVIKLPKLSNEEANRL